MVPQGQGDENANEVMGLNKVKNIVTLEMDGLSLEVSKGRHKRSIGNLR
jgi:hypothetical protein